MPSARNATFTPAPVKPSDRAVFAPLAAPLVPVRARPSGASCGGAAQAPRGGCPAVGWRPAADRAGAGPVIGLSGMTEATPGLLAIAPSDEAGTCAEIASTS